MEYLITDVARELGLYEKGLAASTEGSAGIDLYVASDKPIFVSPTIPVIVPTGIHLWTKNWNYLTLLLPRSSSKFRLTNTVGLIDSDYQGEILAKVLSNDDNSFYLEPGQKFAQIILAQVMPPRVAKFYEVLEFSNTTERGAGGFGSTGH